MKHQMRAEYGPGGPEAGVKTWHIVSGDETGPAMCGRELDPGAETREPARWGEQPALSCHTCGALFLREAPYLPDEHRYREQPE